MGLVTTPPVDGDFHMQHAGRPNYLGKRRQWLSESILKSLLVNFYLYNTETARGRVESFACKSVDVEFGGMHHVDPRPHPTASTYTVSPQSMLLSSSQSMVEINRYYTDGVY